jgi:hypothetical protein
MTRPIVTAIAVIAAVYAADAAAPARASDLNTQVSLCAAALDEQGLAGADEYRAKFLKTKGGATKTVTVRMIAVGNGDSLTAECQIRRGEVIGAEIKA